MQGLYIHIPFCKKKCLYCDFYSIEYREDLAREFIDILSQDIDKLKTSFDTVYIGGGTPTVLSYVLLERILKRLKKIFRKSLENTIEANPESLTTDKLKLFLDVGINRLSIGIQSLNDDNLKFLGRLHSVSMGVEKVIEAKKIGFKNINIDLIYGLPDQSLDAWKKELKEAIKLPITHLSCYILTLEKGVPLYRFKEKINEEVVASMFLYNIRYLPKKGFKHYEVSNFAKKGFQCKHNLGYWSGCSYIGLGPSSVSYFDNTRYEEVRNLNKYLRLKKKGKSTKRKIEELSSLKQAKELVCLGIRGKKGIDFFEFKKKTGFEFWQVEEKKVVDILVKKGLLLYKRKRGKIVGVRLTEKGFLFVDEVCSQFV